MRNRYLMSVAIGMVVCVAGAAEAAPLTFDFSWDHPTRDFSGAGTVTFSGPSAIDGDSVTAFQLDSCSVLGFDCSFISTLTVANFEFDEQGQVESLFLSANNVFPGTFDRIFWTFDLLPSSTEEGFYAFVQCIEQSSPCPGGNSTLNFGAFSPEDASFSVRSVPEPFILPLLAIGLPWLGMHRSRTTSRDRQG